MEPLFEILAEVIIQLVTELLVEIGVRRALRAVANQPGPWLAAIGYALLGAAAGGVSVLLFPSLFLKSPAARYINMVFAPLAAGAAMALLGSWRQRREQRLIRLDRFSYGCLFALAMAIVRFASCD